MRTKRPYYRTKADWAAAEAQRYRQQADLLPTCGVHDWRGVRRRMAAARELRARAERMEQLAAQYRRRGL